MVSLRLIVFIGISKDTIGTHFLGSLLPYKNEQEKSIISSENSVNQNPALRKRPGFLGEISRQQCQNYLIPPII